jgi:hypothetical protein
VQEATLEGRPARRFLEAHDGRTVDEYSKVIAPPIGRDHVERTGARAGGVPSCPRPARRRQLDFDPAGTSRTLISRLDCTPLRICGIASQTLHEKQGFEIGKLDLDALPARCPDVTGRPTTKSGTAIASKASLNSRARPAPSTPAPRPPSSSVHARSPMYLLLFRGTVVRASPSNRWKR